MRNEINMAGLTVASGEKVRKMVTVPGTSYEIPVTVINGVEDGKVFFVTAGVHGLEFPGIQATVELSEELEPEEVSGVVVFVPCVNTPAFFKRRAYICPDDEENRNFNMTFPGKADGTVAQKVAYFITETITKHADFHVDIHSGDVVESMEEFCAVCNCEDKEMQNFVIEAAKHTSFSHRIISHGASETYNVSGMKLKVPGLLFERGGAGILNWDEVERDKMDLISLMQFLKILPGEPIDNSTGQIYYQSHFWGSAHATGLFYKFVDIGDEVNKGQKMGEIRDFNGNVLEEFFAEFTGRVKIANNTLGISEGDDTFMYGCVEDATFSSAIPDRFKKALEEEA